MDDETFAKFLAGYSEYPVLVVCPLLAIVTNCQSLDGLVSTTTLSVDTGVTTSPTNDPRQERQSVAQTQETQLSFTERPPGQRPSPKDSQSASPRDTITSSTEPETTMPLNSRQRSVPKDPQSASLQDTITSSTEFETTMPHNSRQRSVPKDPQSASPRDTITSSTESGEVFLPDESEITIARSLYEKFLSPLNFSFSPEDEEDDNALETELQTYLNSTEFSNVPPCYPCADYRSMSYIRHKNGNLCLPEYSISPPKKLRKSRYATLILSGAKLY